MNFFLVCSTPVLWEAEKKIGFLKLNGLSVTNADIRSFVNADWSGLPNYFWSGFDV